MLMRELILKKIEQDLENGKVIKGWRYMKQYRGVIPGRALINDTTANPVNSAKQAAYFLINEYPDLIKKYSIELELI
jgi:hypothetical protein